MGCANRLQIKRSVRAWQARGRECPTGRRPASQTGPFSGGELRGMDTQPSQVASEKPRRASHPPPLRGQGESPSQHCVIIFDDRTLAYSYPMNQKVTAYTATRCRAVQSGVLGTPIWITHALFGAQIPLFHILIRIPPLHASAERWPSRASQVAR
eukprot:6200616-Pleurochrysis_carterae.AAC.2